MALRCKSPASLTSETDHAICLNAPMPKGPAIDVQNALRTMVSYQNAAKFQEGIGEAMVYPASFDVRNRPMAL